LHLSYIYTLYFVPFHFINGGHWQPYSKLNSVTCAISKGVSFLSYTTSSNYYTGIRPLNLNYDNASIPSSHISLLQLHTQSSDCCVFVSFIDKIMKLLESTEGQLCQIDTWPTYMILHLFIDLPTPHSNLKKVTAFFYGNGVPKFTASKLCIVCNCGHESLITEKMNMLYQKCDRRL
jgi:hypothetical protein